MSKYQLTSYLANGEIIEYPTTDGEPSLERLQELVGGNIEVVPQYIIDDNKWLNVSHRSENIEAIYCNEEGKLDEWQQVNPHFKGNTYDVLVGDIVVVEKIVEPVLDTPAVSRVVNSDPNKAIDYIFDDGGRAEAGFKGSAGDCVTRAIAIATGKPYREVYDDLFELSRSSTMRRARDKASPRDGVFRKVYQAYLESLGWEWIPVMKVGQGVTMHLHRNEIPEGTIIVRLSRHLSAVKDKVVYDTFDPSRGGTRAVYGYFRKAV